MRRKEHRRENADAFTDLLFNVLIGFVFMFAVAFTPQRSVGPGLGQGVLVPAERLEPGQVWTVTVTVNDPWGLSESAEAEIEITNLKPTPAWTTEPEGAIPGTFTTFDGSSSRDRTSTRLHPSH